MENQEKKPSQIIVQLQELQRKIKVAKNRRNDFGGFDYRSCGDILESIKPLLGESLIITLIDDVQMVGNRYYVKATANLINIYGEVISVSAFAREVENRVKMDESQITGSASSYARKYALSGLLALDDNKDADTQSNLNKGKVAAIKENATKEVSSGAMESIKKTIASIKKLSPSKAQPKLLELRSKINSSKHLTKKQSDDLLLLIDESLISYE